MNDQLFPHAIDAEEALLGAVLIDPVIGLPLLEQLDSGVFYINEHRWIAEAMLAAARNAQPIDLITVTNALETAQHLADVGGVAAIAALITRVPSAMHADAYAAAVRQAAQQRAALDIASSLARDAYTATNPTEMHTALYAAVQALRGLEQGNTGGKTAGAGAYAVLEKAQYYQAHQLRPGQVRGIDTGYADLNLALGGLLRGNVYYVLAVPHSGKTFTLLNLLNNVCRGGHSGVLFSLEMSASVDPTGYAESTLWERLVLLNAQLPLAKYRAGLLTGAEEQRLAEAVDLVSGFDLTIYDNVCRFEDIAATLHQLSYAKKLELVCVDYLKLVTPPGGSSDSRNEGLAQTCAAFKQLAREIQTPLIIPHQVSSKAIAQRADKRPTLGDGYYTGDLDQEADVVLGLFRPDIYWTPDEMRANQYQEWRPIELSILKDRPSGGTQSYVKLAFNHTHGRIAPIQSGVIPS